MLALFFIAIAQGFVLGLMKLTIQVYGPYI